MAKDTDGLLLTASLDIDGTYKKIKEEDITKLNAKLANDNSARVKIVGGLDLNKTQSLIQSQITTIGKNLKLNIGQIDTSSLNTAFSNVQNKVIGTNNGLTIKPIVDGKIIEDTDALIKAVVGKLQQLNNVDLKTFKDNLKNIFGISSKEISDDATSLINNLRLKPEDTTAIIQSYNNLIESIRSTFISKGMGNITDGMNFENNVVTSIYKAATEYKNLEQTATRSVKETQTVTKATTEIIDKETQAIKIQTDAYEDLALAKKSVITDASDNQLAKTETYSDRAAGRSKTIVYDSEDNEQVIRYSENINKVVIAQERANASAIKLESTYAKIKSRIEDLNASKPIKDESNKEKLAEQYIKVEQAIDAVKNADSTTLVVMKANAEKEISTLQNLERAFRNAENAAEELRTRDVSTIKTENIQKLAQFEAKIQGSKVPISEMKADLDELNTAIQNIGTNDTEGLTKFLNQFDIARAKFSALNQQMITDNSMQKQAQQAELLTQRVKKLTAEINTYKDSNSKAMQSSQLTSNGKTFSQEIENMLLQLSHCANNDDFQKIAANFRNIKAEAKSLGLEGGTIFDKLWANLKKFSSWMSLTSLVSTFVMDIRNAITELKEIDTVLTEISKTSDRTTESLEKLGKTSFDTASKYGQKASDYLLGVQEMSRAGFGEIESEQMAELYTLAQSAGDMTAELANQYLIATNAAYKLEGSTEKLNRVLDGQNLITNKNALNLSELAEGTKIVASQAANAGIGADQLTAALGTMIATTQQSGSEMANAFKGILINLQQIKGYTDEETGETFDAESLSKYEKACEAMGVSLKEMKDGILQLKNPMQILDELADKYKELDASSTLRANLLSSVGGKYRANALDSLLSNWDTYKKMLSEYGSDEALDSAAKEAQKTAESWEGMFNALENDWSKFVNEFANSDLFKSLIESARRLIDVLSDASSPLNFLLTQVANLLELVTKLTDKIGLIPTIVAGLSLKNVGELSLKYARFYATTNTKHRECNTF